ncbi:hypothetical protein DM872_00390 [Pseudomonas taiwanensis]|nr:hypothetical protein [Pseudomonas taiwanensis]
MATVLRLMKPQCPPIAIAGVWDERAAAGAAVVAKEYDRPPSPGKAGHRSAKSDWFLIKSGKE